MDDSRQDDWSGVGVSAQALAHVNWCHGLVHRRGVFVVTHIPSS